MSTHIYYFDINIIVLKYIVNNKMKKYFLIFGLVLLSGCQTLTSLNFKKLEQQRQFYIDGGVAIQSLKQASGITLAASSSETLNGQRIALALKADNFSSNAFDIDTRNITIQSNYQKPIRVYSYSELVKEETDRRNLQLMLAAISGAANVVSASNAGTSHSSGTFNASTYGPSGAYNTTGQYNTTTHNPAVSQAAIANANLQTQNQISNISESSNNRLNNLKSGILKRTTIFPGYSHSGMFLFDAPALKKGEVRRYTVSVSVNGEPHQFELLQTIKPK